MRLCTPNSYSVSGAYCSSRLCRQTSTCDVGPDGLAQGTVGTPLQSYEAVCKAQPGENVISTA